jgi:exopolysaccharide biosynthesis WecB/TagA/CpsF family protein
MHPGTARASTVDGCQRVSICRVDIDAVDVEQAVEAVLRERHHEGYRYVVTPNAQHLVRIGQDRGELATIYRRAFLCVNDSRVVSRLLALFFRAEFPVCPGSDLTEALLTRLNQDCGTIAVVGMGERHLPRLQRRFPNLTIRHHNPPMGFIEDDSAVGRCLEFLVRNPAGIILFAVGSPQQEILAARFCAVPEASGIGLCIGASIDFLVGAQTRAPIWLQKAGLEWAYRLLREPRRLARRYLIESPRVIYGIWKHRHETRTGLRRCGLMLR